MCLALEGVETSILHASNTLNTASLLRILKYTPAAPVLNAISMRILEENMPLCTLLITLALFCEFLVSY